MKIRKLLSILVAIYFYLISSNFLANRYESQTNTLMLHTASSTNLQNSNRFASVQLVVEVYQNPPQTMQRYLQPPNSVGH